MLILDAAAVRDALHFGALIPALRTAFKTGATVPLRHSHVIVSQGKTGTSLIMPAWNAQGYYGVKTVNIFPGNAQRGSSPCKTAPPRSSGRA